MTKSDSVRNQRNGTGDGDSCPGRRGDYQNAARTCYDALAWKMELVDAR